MAGSDGSREGTHSELSGSAHDVVQARDIAGGIHFYGANPEPKLVPAQLPADVHGFVNRTADLVLLDEAIEDIAGRESAATYVIAGTAGVGKTSLAIRWAHRNLDNFPDGQLYVNLRGYDLAEPVAAGQVLERFLTALGVPAATLPADVEARAALYRSCLAHRKMLVLLDNAAAVKQVRPLLPGAGQCLVLVTSRSRLDGLGARDGARHLTVDLFGESEAAELLRATVSGYRTGDDDDELVELARLCARLPLALRVAGQRAAVRPHMPMADLIGTLRDASQLWDALSIDGGEEEEADMVQSVFAWSYRALRPEVARLFRLVGLHPGPEFSADAAAALAGIDVAQARRALDVLVSVHLLSQSAHNRYQFHDLLRAYAIDTARQTDSDAERAAATERLLRWYLHSADHALLVWPARDPAIARVPLDREVDAVRPLDFPDGGEANTWLLAERVNFPAIARMAVASEQDRLAWQVGGVLRGMYAMVNAFDDWFAVAELGLQSARRSDDIDGQAYLHESLIMACRQTYRLDRAESHGRAALDLYQRMGNRYGQAFVLNLLALVCSEGHRLRAAQDYLRQAESLCREDGFSGLLPSVLGNQAWALSRSGRNREAYEIALQVLELRRARDSLFEEFETHVSLMRFAHQMGDYVDAVAWAVKALDVSNRDGRQAAEGYMMPYYADLQRDQGDLAGALASYQRSASIQRSLGDRNREALAVDGAGTAFRRQGHLAEAVASHRAAAAIYREVGNTWGAAVALDHLAGVLNEAGNSAEAADRWQEALPLVEQFDDPPAVSLRDAIRAALAHD